MYAYVKDGKIERFGQLPKVWEMQDGTTVSGFHLLDDATILSEGWYKVVENTSSYDEQTHYLSNQTYEIKGDKVVTLYSIEPIPEPEPELPHVPSQEEDLDEMRNKISNLQLENEMLQSSLIEMTMYAVSQDERLATQENALLEVSMLIMGGM